MTLTLHGPCPGKKNLLRFARKRVYRDAEIAKQIGLLVMQARAQWSGRALEHPNLAVRFFVRSKRADRDNKITTILDVLQEAGVIHQDNIKWFNGVVTILPAVVDKQSEMTVIEITETMN